MPGHFAIRHAYLKRFRDLVALKYVGPPDIRSADQHLVHHFRPRLLRRVSSLVWHEQFDMPPGPNLRGCPPVHRNHPADECVAFAAFVAAV